MSSSEKSRIAFITTPVYRDQHTDRVKEFIYRHLYSLCDMFDVLSTGRTYKFIDETVNQKYQQHSGAARSLMFEDTHFQINDDKDLGRWQETINSGLIEMGSSFQGMIDVAYELVEGRLDAVIHLTDWQDLSGKPDSAVLWREANVHNIPIAHNIDTAKAYVQAWRSRLARLNRGERIFRHREILEESPLTSIGESDKVLGLIAHDAQKTNLCCFVVEHAQSIVTRFDYVLATGTTGARLQEFLKAAGRGPDEVKKVRRCLSGPYGGDVQIAYAVIRNLCQKIIFFQDPFMSHPHDSDIRLFEQAVLAGVAVELATNAESARLLLES